MLIANPPTSKNYLFMRIHIRTPHKSIPRGLNFELPDFCVLTGINGSGKSHLLEALADTNKSTIIKDGNALLNIVHVGFNGLSPQISEQSDSNQVIQSINQFWGQVQGVIAQYNQMVSNGNEYNKETVITQFLRNYVQHKPTALGVAKILKATGKEIDQLKQEDISSDLIFAQAMHGQLFSSQIALIFKAYHTRFVKNEIAEFRSMKHGSAIPFLTTEEFKNKFGPPPWELINDILIRAGLPYQVTNPEADDHELPYYLKLIDAQRNIEISVNDLSSGEKVLMSLALAIYNTGVGGVKPDLLLLDEPDAPLHPHFSKLLIEVLLETVVQRAGVSVVFTTHSPTTVAMSPDGSVFEVSKDSKIPQMVSNAHAVELLTEGLSYLRVSYDKRKQVFVESKYDVLYFERLYNLLKRKYEFDYVPVFLEPHSGTSNCTDVISIVDKLRGSGGDLAYGIIDYDGGNRSNDAVLVLGNGARYAIENYILDPLYLALALIRYGRKTFSDFGVAGKSTYMEASNLSEAECQQIVNSILQSISIPLVDLKAATFINGQVVNYPVAYLLHQGHDYEKKIAATYPELQTVSRGRGDSGLKLGVLQIIEELPQYLPVEVVKTFSILLGVRP